MLLWHYIFIILIISIFFSNLIKKIISDIIREGQLRERRDLQDSLYRYQGIFLFKKIHGVHSYFDVEVGGTRVTSQILVGTP